MNGPKGISSFLPFIFKVNNNTEMMAPSTKDNNVINNTPLMPNISPNAAISLISPPPMAFDITAMAKNIPNPIASPINLSNKTELLIIMIIIPIIATAIFKLSGIILCFISIILIAINKLITKQYIIEFIVIPYLSVTNPYNIPFNNSIKGYCIE